MPTRDGGPTNGRATEYAIGSLERALFVLDTLAAEPDLTLTDILARVGATKGTVFRHLKVLEQHGYVVAGPGKRYALGPRLMQLGHIAHEQLALPKVARVPMIGLRDRFNETVHLGVLIGDDVVHVESVPSTQPLKMAAALGERTWPHISALGKCLLAWSGEERLAKVVAHGLPRMTERTLVELEPLAGNLRDVRTHGYAIDDEESNIGLRCVGAPVHDAEGSVIAAMSVSGPTERITQQRVPEIAAAVVAAAREVSARCGWAEPAMQSANTVG
jgi:IclR family transcriptional regulator, KDG regulon repressor